MNIFGALSQGNGRITETNITSFLSYLLNDNSDFGKSFIILFLKSLSNINKLICFEESNIRKLVNEFSRFYMFSASPEVRVTYNGKTQIIDIIITIMNKDTQEDIMYILIENKIKKSALNKTQCLTQYEFVKNSEDFNDNIPIYSILITPPDEAFREMYDNVSIENGNSQWLSWTENSINLLSIESMIRELIRLENNLEISPINNISKYVLKSFVEHITNEIGEKSKQYNYSLVGTSISDEAKYSLNKTNYSLKRYSNNSIRIYDIDDNEVNKSVFSELKAIIEKYHLDIEIGNKNTRTLGKEVIKELNNNA